MITEHNEYAERKWLHNSIKNSYTMAWVSRNAAAFPNGNAPEFQWKKNSKHVSKNAFLLIVFHFRGNNSMLVLSPSNETYL